MRKVKLIVHEIYQGNPKSANVNAAFPAMMLSKASETAMGTVNTVIGLAMLLGSIFASVMKAPKSRVKAIWYCLMLSMCTENFFWHLVIKCGCDALGRRSCL